MLGTHVCTYSKYSLIVIAYAFFIFKTLHKKCKSKELYDAAFPERKIWWKCIANRQPIAAADMELEEAGLPTLFDSDAS